MLNIKDLDGLTRYNTNGYYQYYIPDHHLANKAGLVYEHQIMAEIMLGRDLNPKEVVHHKDKNRENNSLNNLMVFKTSADHSAYHAGREIILEGDVYVALDKYIRMNNDLKDKCPYCNNLKSHNADMCLECYEKEHAKNIPAKDELYKLLKNNSICAIGRIYGVSDNAVRKWCRKYGLPFTRKDIKIEFGIM